MKSWAVTESNGDELNKYTDPELSLQVFDSRDKRLKKIDNSKDLIQIYVCGITPYDSAHFGHAFTYLSFDLMVRALKLLGNKTNYVQNVTDIDDPLFERAKLTSTPWKEIVSEQIEIYRNDMEALNILPPDKFVGVDENMSYIIKNISESIENDLAYQIGTEWYFKNNDHNQSKLTSGMDQKELTALAKERGCDVDREGKIKPLDPIIWRASKEDEPSWKTDFGTGRPGWHIQCVSLIKEFTDMPLTIQGGGKDLIFPHHAMCDSQSHDLGLGELAKNYCHVGMVSYQGSKMSKSKGNLVFVHQLINEGINPMIIRIGLMSHHWQSDWEFTQDELKQAELLYNNLLTKKNQYMTVLDFEKITKMLLNNLQIPEILNFLSNLDASNDFEGKISIDLVLTQILGLKLEGVNQIVD
jgi:L-cysteine:1D-myo-inositol 2-amino-2-deoxy-alpha-D-glucopyranoside ligase